MIWREVITKATEFLEARGVEDARVAGELLGARLLRVGRGMLASVDEKEAGERELEAMRRGLARLVKGEPIQYILGEWDFRSLTLKCDRRALIPRPETEELVTRAMDFLKGREKPVVVDVGTGTGAIILSIAKELREGVFVGTDVSEEAVALAKENAALTGLEDKVKMVVMDGLDDFDEPQCLDVIVSNPPYIESTVCETLERKVKDFEPRLALDGGPDGVAFYERYAGDAVNLLKPGGKVFFEIGENQGKKVSQILFDYGFSEIKIEKDLAGHDRYASGVLKE